MKRARWLYIVWVFLLAFVYYVTARIGLQLDPVGGFATLVWASSGISLFALFVLGYRFWPGIALGAFFANLHNGAPLFSAFGITTGNTLEAVIGVYLLRRIIGFNPGLSRVRDVIGLVTLGAIASTGIGAAIGVTSLWLGGVFPFSDIWTALRAWWIGDALGDIVAAPFLFSWAARPANNSLKRRTRIAELAALTVMTAGGTVCVFAGSRLFTAIGSPEVYLIFSFIMWGALRFSARETSTLILLVSVIAILGTIRGTGPFAGRSLSENLLFLQLFMGVLAVTGLLMSAAICERKTAERKFKLVIESAPNAMIVVNQAGRIALVNAQAEKYFGYKRIEMLGQPVEMLIPQRFRGAHPGYRAEYVRSPMMRAMGKGRDLYGLRKDGSEFCVEIGLSPVRDTEGVQVLSSIIDVTERKRSEEGQKFLSEAGTILASSLDYRETLKKVAHLALPKLADWCLVDLAVNGAKQVAAAHMNSEKEKMAEVLANRFPPDPSLGRGAGYVMQTARSEMYPDVADDNWVAETLGTGYPKILSELGAVSYMCVPLLARGRSLGAITFVFGESKRRYDPFFLSLAEELARRAAMAIDNAHLFFQMQEAARNRDDIMAIVSHDLKNPLFAIIQGASMLLETLPPAQKDDFAPEISASILHAANHMDRLVNNLLDFAKLERGDIIIEPQPYPVSLLIDKALSPFRMHVIKKSLRVSKMLEPPDLSVTCDHDRIIQVISNLLDNAVKFTPIGGSISITAKLVESEIEFAVKDTGAGIPKDQLERIFDRFSQGRGPRKQGMGLGLYLAKGLVRLHGGRIWAKSREREGSEFYFRLPAGKPAPQNRPEPAPAMSQAAGRERTS